ncbi:MAG: anti-sigma factor family protein [Bryobacteraceae bacterium]
MRDYFFDELGEAERSAVDAHLAACGACHEELDRLRLTQATLRALPDEEIPRRIGFVSDRVWEPSRLRRTWNALWNSGPRLGFASAAMLSAALALYSLRPVAVDAEVARRVAASEARMVQQIAAAEKRLAEQRARDIQAVSEGFELLEKEATYLRRASLEGRGL